MNTIRNTRSPSLWHIARLVMRKEDARQKWQAALATSASWSMIVRLWRVFSNRQAALYKVQGRYCRG